MPNAQEQQIIQAFLGFLRGGDGVRVFASVPAWIAAGAVPPISAPVMASFSESIIDRRFKSCTVCP